MKKLTVLGVVVAGLLATMHLDGVPAPGNDHTTWRDYAGGADASRILGAHPDQSIEREQSADRVDLSDR